MDATVKDYLKYIKRRCPKLTETDLEYIGKKLYLSEIPAKAFYLEQNENQSQIGYVLKGLIRTFYTTPEGEEITVAFNQENGPVADYKILEHPLPSRFSFQAIEDSLVINFPYEHLIDCADKIPAFERFIRLILEETFLRISARMEGFLFYAAEDRYLKFIRENPGLLRRISVSHLCSFLGITRQALTRIRKKIICPDLPPDASFR